MFRLGLPNSDTALLLTPRWGELPLPLQILVLAALVLVPIVLVLWLYRYELKLVAGPTALLLLLLRLTAILLAVFLVGFQPILGKDWTEKLPGRVLVAVDRSLSMDVADPQRPVLEKLRLARALRLAADLVPDSQLDAWIKQYQDAGEPQWVAPDEHANDSEKRQQVAEQRHQQHDKVCERVDALTRSQVARRVLGPDGVNLLQLVASRHRMEVMAFARDARDGSPDDLDALLRTAADAKKTGDDGMRTDLRLPLERALKQDGEGEGKIVGVVLLTDGQHNVHEPGNLRREPPAKKSIELGEHGLPVFPVALGARQGPPDVALVGLKAQPTVFKDVDLPVEARFKVTGIPAGEIVVELQRPGKPAIEKKIKHDGKDAYHNVTFQVRMDEAGTKSMTVTARPVEKETRADNNGRPVTVNVADEKARVLLIDGEARWELHYLATVLQRDRAMQPTSVVYLQPRLGKIPEDDLLKAGGARTTLPEGPDSLAGYDCIILGDVSPEQLPLPDRQRLEKYVADRGGTLVMLAGKRFMPLGFPLQDARGATELDPIQRLLPVEQPRTVTPLKGFPVSLTEEGRLTPFLQMDEEGEESETRWAELPPHYWGVVGKAKPGATPLAFYADPKDDDLKGDKKTAREKDNALIARHNYGFGRVLFVGLDSTWRWRYKVGDVYHHRFWSQAIRWAASDKPLIAGNEYVRFGAPEPVYKQGQAVDVVVRLAEEVRPLAPDAAAGARIIRLESGGKEEGLALVPLARREAQPRVLEGQVADLPAGQYAIELVIPELADRLNAPPGPDGKPGKLRAGFTVSGPEGEETIELATNWPLLEEIAAKSGGQVFTPENAAGLVELLREKGATKTERWEFRLWQSWLTLLLFLAVLTVEWVLRKFAGLP